MLSAEKAYERRWYTLAVLCMSLVIITIDNSILNVALPTIVRDLGASGSDLQWIIDSYIIVFASLLLTAGALGDKFGRKGALTFGLLIFGGFSGLASLATTPEMLIVARGLMGIGAAFIFPTTLSILTNTFTGRERATAIGVWAGVSGIGVALGPLLGGILVEHFYWGAVFFVNVPICALALVLGHFYIPTSRDPDNRPLDPVGALLSIVTLVALLYAIIQAPEKGWMAPEVVAAFVGALGAPRRVRVVGDARRRTDDRRARVPQPRFSAASSVLTLTSFALYGSVFLLIQYFQFVLGYSPLEAGLLAMPVALAMMVVSPNAPRLVRRWGTKRVVVLGLLIAAVAMLCYGSDADHVVVRRGLRGAPPVRHRARAHLGAGDRVDHGIAAAEPRRRRFGDQRHHATDRRRARRRHHRERVPRGVPPLRRQGAGPLGSVVGRGARLGGAGDRAGPHAAGRAGRGARCRSSRDAFVDAMRITYPIAAAFIAPRRVHRLAVPPGPRSRRVRVGRGRGGSARSASTRSSAPSSTIVGTVARVRARARRAGREPAGSRGRR